MTPRNEISCKQHLQLAGKISQSNHLRLLVDELYNTSPLVYWL